MPKVKMPEHVWYVFVTLSAVGGQGKSFFAELITLLIRSLRLRVNVFSADVQARLATKLDQVIQLDTDLLDVTDDDPLALLRAFSPLAESIESSVLTRENIVLDTAATWDLPTLKVLRDMRLDQVVTANGGKLVMALVTTSNLDAMCAMVRSTKLVRASLPGAQIMWVINERFGEVFGSGFNPRSLGLEPEEFAEMRASVSEMTIPRMDDRIWQPIDRAGMNFLQFVTATPATLAALWTNASGKPLDALSTAAVQRRVSAWIGNMMGAASKAAGFRDGENRTDTAV